MNDISSFLKFLTNNYESTFKLSTFDIKLKYRRTLLGDYWSILTNLIALGIISIIWSVVFNGVFIKYFAMIFIGMTSFYMLISFISNSSEILYTTYKDDLLSRGIPLNIVLQRYFMQIVLEYIQLFPIYFIISIVVIDRITFEILLFIPGLILVLLNCFLLSLMVSIICSRFRDLGLLIKSIMRAGVLLTPILWDKSRLGEFENWIYLNPFTSMIEALRNPLLGMEINYMIYLILFFILLINTTVSYILLKHKHKVFAFWL